MKFRKGFVTNSSSSSYVCDICGANESGMDMGLEDAQMYECRNGHIFCESHTSDIFEDADFMKSILESQLQNAISRSINDWWTQERKDAHVKECNDQLQEFIDGNVDVDDLEDLKSDARYNLPEKYCPICQMDKFIDGDILAYILKQNNFDRKVIEATIKDRFASFNDFREFVKQK